MNSKKMPAQSKIDYAGEIRRIDRAAIAACGDKFNVPEFCRAWIREYPKGTR